MPRPLPDIIAAGLQLMEPIPTPDTFKHAAVVTLISSLLARRVWVKTEVDLPINYPNLYTMLVAPPAVGKDVAVSWVRRTLIELQARVGEQRRIWSPVTTTISPKGIYDALNNADKTEQTFRNNRQVYAFRSLTFLIGEMSTIMTDYDQKLVGVLNDVYNCSERLDDTIRGQDYVIPNPHAVILIGNQPTTLFDTFPEKSFSMGFPSRFCIFIARDKVKRRKYNVNEEKETAAHKKLYEDFMGCLEDLTLMSGQFQLSYDAGEWLNSFAEDEPFQVPGARWQHYNTRRELILTKLAMIFSASESCSRKIKQSHCEAALQLMLSYEKDLPHLFDGVVSAEGFSSIFEEIYELVERLAKPILVPDPDNPPSERLSHYEVTHLKLSRELSRTNNAHKQEKLFGELKRSGILVPKVDKVEGQPAVLHQPLTYIVRPMI